MRFRAFFLACLCSALGVVSALGYYDQGTTSFTLTGAKDGGVTVYLQTYRSDGLTMTSQQSLSPGYAGTYNINYERNLTAKYKWVVSCDGNRDFGMTEGMPAPMTFNMSDCSYGSPTTYYYCYYCVNWTNTGTTIAVPTAIVVQGNGELKDMHQEIGGDTVAGVIRPGGYWNMCYTNWYGTNAPVGGCGYLLFGDGRPDATVPDSTVNGTQGTVTTSPGNGSTGGGSKDNPGANTPLPQGGTNAPSQGDLNLAANRIVQAVADVGNAVHRADEHARTNALYTGEKIDGVKTAVQGMGTNLVAAIDSLRTNGISGNGSNTNGGPYDGYMTNLISIRTNSEATAAVLAGLTNSSSAIGSNALYAVTNLMGPEWGSNVVTGMRGTVSNLTSYGDSAQGVASALAGRIGGTAPDDDWGVIKLRYFGQTDPYWEMDLKPSIQLGPLAEYVGDFRGWFRVFILWMTLIVCIKHFAHEIRVSIRDVLTVPRLHVPTVEFVAAGAAAGGPPGAAVGLSVAFTMKAFVASIVFAGLLFLPSIMVTAAATICQIIGEPTYLPGGSAAGVVNNAPAVMWYVVYLIAGWFPLVELALIGLNVLFAELGLEGATTFAMGYVKVVQP